MQQGHDETAARAGGKRVVQALANTLESTHGRWVLEAREQAASEYALATTDGERVSHHVIDRTFIEDGVRWVVDYKSAGLDDGVAQEKLEQQAERYRPQLERYARLFEHESLPVCKAVFYLAHGKLITLP
jgi:ATP-dependent exoDNAse (exonuclease V) beta subunit